MGKYRTRRGKTSAAFGTGAAMADLAMLLLIFFMTATTTEPPKGVEVVLPKAVTEGAEQDSIYITISADGNIWLDGRSITLPELNDRLAARQSEKDSVVSVTADSSLPYSSIRQVLDTLKRNNFLNVVFMAEAEKK